MSGGGLASPEAREEAIYTRFRELGIAWKTFAHIPVFTVPEADGIHTDQPGGHTKNLFLKDKKGGLWLVVARDDAAIDLNALSRQLESPRFSFGSAELLIATLGVPPGSVTPFALINDPEHKVRVVLDEEMLTSDPLNFHPLRNERTSAVSAEDFMRFIRASGHSFTIASLPLRAETAEPDRR